MRGKERSGGEISLDNECRRFLPRLISHVDNAPAFPGSRPNKPEKAHSENGVLSGK